MASALQWELSEVLGMFLSSGSRGFVFLLAGAVVAACSVPIPGSSANADDELKTEAAKNKGTRAREQAEEDGEGAPENAPEGAGESADKAPDRFPGSKVFVPTKTPAPAVLMLHGSEGGNDGTLAEYAEALSEEGFVVLSFCWFQCADTPSLLKDVSLDRTVEAARWLKATPEVGGQPLGLFGWSRGGEQAVLLGSLTKDTKIFAAVAAHAPSDTIVAAFDPDNPEGDLLDTDPDTGNEVFAAAWTWKGKKLFGEKAEPWGSGPRIAVEAYAGPMYISHGTEDQTWEVDRSRRIVASREKKSTLVTESRFWEGEDHVPALYSPSNEREWKRLLATFFQKKLGAE